MATVAIKKKKWWNNTLNTNLPLTKSQPEGLFIENHRKGLKQYNRLKELTLVASDNEICLRSRIQGGFVCLEPKDDVMNNAAQGIQHRFVLYLLLLDSETLEFMFACAAFWLCGCG